ncbi:MAG: helix-turn-helix domain-containing protein [Nitrososphaerales archaeon]|nr:helix-turn-helix domain-containing protein [Nitrososphaerales archaeon]
MKKLVTMDEEGRFRAKDITIYDDPRHLKPLLNPIGWKILSLIAKRSMYPAEIAKTLGIYEQTIYYHIRRLEKAGHITIDKKENIRGTLAKYYRITSSAFGIELPGEGVEFDFTKRLRVDHKLLTFFKPFVKDDEFNGLIVVGSPEPHGPNKTYARDGHYGIQLALLLGQFCRVPKKFVVKLDVDVKTEKEEKNNMILIGGPGTNLITADVNRYLPIHFDERNYWAGLKDRRRGYVYNMDSDGIIAKIKNPFNQSSSIIVLAGLRYVGTKSAIIALCNFHEEVLKNYNGEDEWAIAIRGFDLDGDGKVDAIETLAQS